MQGTQTIKPQEDPRRLSLWWWCIFQSTLTDTLSLSKRHNPDQGPLFWVLSIHNYGILQDCCGEEVVTSHYFRELWKRLIWGCQKWLLFKWKTGVLWEFPVCVPSAYPLVSYKKAVQAVTWPPNMCKTPKDRPNFRFEFAWTHKEILNTKIFTLINEQLEKVKAFVGFWISALTGPKYDKINN